ncbi:MAG: hypothetical protein ACRC6M_18310, partial [Microcystaceae cyanobacterium]
LILKLNVCASTLNFIIRTKLMAITLKQEQEKFILDKIQQGKYTSADDLLAIAFQLAVSSFLPGISLL